MEQYAKLLLVLLVGFFVSLILSPIIISIIKKEKVKQVILHYVESHKQKSGTPTMGGIIFIIAILLTSLIFFDKQNMTLGLVSLMSLFAFGLVGFLDDFLKFKFKQNMGLRPYQKIIFQLTFSIILSVFAFKSSLIGSAIILPFSGRVIDIGWWIIPLNVFVIIATTNSVNLTDGLDGLATGTSLSFLLSFFALLLILFGRTFEGQSTIYLQQINSVNVVVFASLGALLCYLLFNSFPAKIFMGDTGSLALGGMFAAMVITTKTTLYLPFLGIMFVASSVSVILQVSYYKLTKKRIFLMAPLHHHFEKKGMHEVRISVMYATITLVVGAMVALIELV
ncbi:MAG: phospho-N-acetylmuramoyl-pentapeptide-transferase [Clostridia bacterium]|nr:phospho-N-acetylmuramoyl-pentapeptide-transferase [Clostridia bacterium]